ncbi:PKD2 [Symbiodinium sp. CCMP2592]|nr:PKD2 [Symbiodinium sp. CCMP2592]
MQRLSRGTVPGGSSASLQLLQRPLHRVQTKIPDRVFYWIDRSVFDQASLKIEDVLLCHGVPEQIVMNDLRGQIAEQDALKSLPSAFLLVLLYTCTLLSTSSISDVWALQHAVSFDIVENANFGFSGNHGHQSLQDVNTFTDFSSWLELGFQPLFLSKTKEPRENSTAMPETMKPEEFDMYLLHMRKVGPVKLAQMVLAPGPCRARGLAESYGLSCGVQNNEYFMEATADELLQNSFVEESSRTVWLANLGPDGHFLARWPAGFSASRWLSRDTLRARLSFVVYSPELDMLLLTNLEFMFPRTGHIWKDITHRALPLSLFETWSSLTFEVMFYALITVLLLTELWEIFCLVRRMRKNRLDWRGFLGLYLNVWNCVDWCCIVLAYLLLGSQLKKASMTIELREGLEDYPQTVRSCYQDSQPELCADRLGEELLKQIEAVGILAHNCRLLKGIYPAIVILRMLKAFSAQPRLAILTRTLSAAAVDLFHFGLVFLSVFAAFAVMGTAFFGQDELQFSTLDRAASVLFFALMGEVRWTSIDSLGRPVALLFFGAFQFVGLLLMLNMLIAIMMDIYACTKSCATRSEPLWTSVMEVTSRNWEEFMRREVPLPKLLKMCEKQRGLDMYESEEIIQVQDLMQWLPGLKSEQADRIFIHALLNYRRQKDEPVGMEEVLQAVADTLADVVALSELLPRADQVENGREGMGGPCESCRPCAKSPSAGLDGSKTAGDDGHEGFVETHTPSVLVHAERHVDSPRPLPTLLQGSASSNVPVGSRSSKMEGTSKLHADSYPTPRVLYSEGRHLQLDGSSCLMVTGATGHAPEPEAVQSHKEDRWKLFYEAFGDFSKQSKKGLTRFLKALHAVIETGEALPVWRHKKDRGLKALTEPISLKLRNLASGIACPVLDIHLPKQVPALSVSVEPLVQLTDLANFLAKVTPCIDEAYLKFCHRLIGHRIWDHHTDKAYEVVGFEIFSLGLPIPVHTVRAEDEDANQCWLLANRSYAVLSLSEDVSDLALKVALNQLQALTRAEEYVATLDRLEHVLAGTEATISEVKPEDIAGLDSRSEEARAKVVTLASDNAFQVLELIRAEKKRCAFAADTTDGDATAEQAVDPSMRVHTVMIAVSDEIPFELFWPMVKDDIVGAVRELCPRGMPGMEEAVQAGVANNGMGPIAQKLTQQEAETLATRVGHVVQTAVIVDQEAFQEAQKEKAKSQQNEPLSGLTSRIQFTPKGDKTWIPGTVVGQLGERFSLVDDKGVLYDKLPRARIRLPPGKRDSTGSASGAPIQAVLSQADLVRIREHLRRRQEEWAERHAQNVSANAGANGTGGRTGNAGEEAGVAGSEQRTPTSSRPTSAPAVAALMHRSRASSAPSIDGAVRRGMSILSREGSLSEVDGNSGALDVVQFMEDEGIGDDDFDEEGGPVDDDEDEDLPPLEAHEADGGLAAGRLGASRGSDGENREFGIGEAGSMEEELRMLEQLRAMEQIISEVLDPSDTSRLRRPGGDSAGDDFFSAPMASLRIRMGGSDLRVPVETCQIRRGGGGKGGSEPLRGEFPSFVRSADSANATSTLVTHPDDWSSMSCIFGSAGQDSVVCRDLHKQTGTHIHRNSA